MKNLRILNFEDNPIKACKIARGAKRICPAKIDRVRNLEYRLKNNKAQFKGVPFELGALLSYVIKYSLNSISYIHYFTNGNVTNFFISSNTNIK